jgi:hypothetical protein
MHFVMRHVEFENWLSFSVLENKATCQKIYSWKSINFKCDHFFFFDARAHLISQTRLFQTLVCTGACHKRAGSYSKESSHGDGFKQVLLTG